MGRESTDYDPFKMREPLMTSRGVPPLFALGRAWDIKLLERKTLTVEATDCVVGHREKTWEPL